MTTAVLRPPGKTAPKPQPPASEPPAHVPFKPAPPKTLEEAGISPEMLDALIFKYLVNVGSAPGAQIASALALPHPLVVERLSDLKRQQLVTYVGAATMGDFTYTLNETGRDRAARCMAESMYIGAAPVPLSDYSAAVRAQSITHEQPDHARLKGAFDDLLINQHMFDTLGPAINSGRGMFLYGFPGNGKTSIAERITKCFGTEIYIPYAIHVDGFIIKLYDAEIHERIATQQSSILKADQLDERWVRIKRPTVVVGGELTMDQLEVKYNTTTKISEASMHLKRNCGTLVIDDFGRDRMTPFELLTRWIVPLEKRFDYLNLANGQKIQVPFDQLLIFSTNLEPKDLVDDAFLRRIPYKINVCDPSEEEFRELFRIMSKIVGFEHNEELVSNLIDTHYRSTDRPFRCCQPRDLLLLAKNRCQYKNEPVQLTQEALDFAASVYFTVM